MSVMKHLWNVESRLGTLVVLLLGLGFSYIT